MNATVFTQKENTINDRKVWLYLISAPIGHIIVVDYEVAGEKNIIRKLFSEDYEKAEAYFDSVCRRIIGGKL